MHGQRIALPEQLKAFIDSAFIHYPHILELEENNQINLQKITLERAAFLPQMNADLVYHRLYPTPVFDLPLNNNMVVPLQFFPPNSINTGISLSEPLLDFSIGVEVDRAKQQEIISGRNLDQFKVWLAYRICSLYYTAIFLHRSIQVQQELLNCILENIDQIQVRIKNGDALQYDLLTAQVTYSNAHNVFNDIQWQKLQNEKELEMFTMISDLPAINDTFMQDHVFDLSKDSAEKTALHQNFDILLARDKIDMALLDIKAVNRSRLPSVVFQGGLGYKNGYIPDMNDILFNYFIGLGIHIPIVSGTHPNLRHKIACLNATSCQYAYQSQTMKIINEISIVGVKIQTNEIKFKESSIQIEQARLAMELSKDRFNHGVLTNLELLSAISSYHQSLLSNLQFQFNLLQARIELCLLAGLKCW